MKTLSIRITRPTHKMLAEIAEKDGLSLSQFIRNLLERSLSQNSIDDQLLEHARTLKHISLTTNRIEGLLDGLIDGLAEMGEEQ